MKASLIAIALVLPVGIALAQKPDEQSKKGSNTASSSAEAQSSAKAGKAGEVNTKNYKGTLVDAACAGGSGAPTAASSSSRAASTAKAGEASRETGGGQSCDATASTTDFGLRTHDGHVLRFDSVGNERAKEAISSRKKWSGNAAAGKPVQASISGMESGDTLTVLSIN